MWIILYVRNRITIDPKELLQRINIAKTKHSLHAFRHTMFLREDVGDYNDSAGDWKDFHNSIRDLHLLWVWREKTRALRHVRRLTALRRENDGVINTFQVASAFLSPRNRTLCLWCGFGRISWTSRTQKILLCLIPSEAHVLWFLTAWLWPHSCHLSALSPGDWNKAGKMESSAKESGFSPPRCEKERAGVGEGPSPL